MVTHNLGKYNWKRLNPLQLGRYAEYFTKMEFTLYNFDVYTTEVDDKGIDFVIRKKNKYYDIQVKSVRNNNYIFFTKTKFDLRKNLLMAVLYFYQGEQPKIYLIPSLEWKKPNELLVDKEYKGLKSKPEYGINASQKNQTLLEKYNFEAVANQL